MRGRWPWETKRLGTHHHVVRPWRPLEDRRVLAVVSLAGAAGPLLAVWWLHPAAGMAVDLSAAAVSAAALLWGRRAWRRG